MFIDASNMFCDADAVTASAASESVIDLVSAQVGKGKRLEVQLSVQTTFVSGALDGTLTVSLQTSAAEAFGSYTTLWSLAAVNEADLVAGYRFECPPIPDNTLRYLRLYFTVAGSGNFTAGNLDAAIVEALQSNNYEAMAAFIS